MLPFSAGFTATCHSSPHAELGCCYTQMFPFGFTRVLVTIYIRHANLGAPKPCQAKPISDGFITTHICETRHRQPKLLVICRCAARADTGTGWDTPPAGQMSFFAFVEALLMLTSHLDDAGQPKGLEGLHSRAEYLLDLLTC